MICEVATINVHLEKVEEFEKMMIVASNLFQQSDGCLGMKLESQIENPAIYYIKLQWNELEDHTIKFKQSPLFNDWRELIAKFCTIAPSAVHTRNISNFF